MILQVGTVRAIPSKHASYGVLGRWRGRASLTRDGGEGRNCMACKRPRTHFRSMLHKLSKLS